MHYCKKLIFILLIFPIHLLSANEECYIQITINSKEDISHLSNLVSIDSQSRKNFEDGYLMAYTGTDTLPVLQKMGYQVKRFPHPGLNPDARMGLLSRSKDRAWDAYPTYSEYVQMMNDFVTNYPNLCSLHHIGASTNTVRPHDLWVLKISEDPHLEQDEPEVLFTSTMHGDETTGFVTMLRLIDELLSHYDPLSADPYDMEITAMIQNMEIWINPLANPDGTYYGDDSSVSGAIRSYATSTGGYAGIDPNRNFPDPVGGPHPDGNAHWAETIAMMDFADQNHFVLSSNFHGGIEVMNYPWDTWQRRHADDAWLIDVCRNYADLAQLNGPVGYFTSLNNGITNGYDWYHVEGGRQDYMNYWHGCREITNEISTTKSPLGSNLPIYWDANRQALLNYLKESLKGIRGIVTSQAGTPLAATIEIVGHDVEIDQSMVKTDPEVGDYHRMLLPGTYTIRASAYGYLPMEFPDISVSGGDATIQHFVLQPASTVTVTGIVTSSPGNVPLAGATVELLDTPFSPVQTGPAGTFTFEGVVEDYITFRISATDHGTIEEERLVTAGSTVQNFSLPRIATYLFEDFETDDGGLMGDGSWAYGTPSGSGLTPTPYSGDHLWATNLSGNYAINEHSYLQIDGIQVPSNFPKFEFRHWYQFENTYDGGRVEIAIDGGAFTPITPLEGYTGNINALSGEGYGGYSNGWLFAQFDLSAYADQTVSIRWHFASDVSNNYLGWYIDDLQLTGQADGEEAIFSDGFETGDTTQWDHTITNKTGLYILR